MLRTSETEQRLYAVWVDDYVLRGALEVSPGPYFRYHQHQPSFTSTGLTWVPSSKITLARVLILVLAVSSLVG